MLRDPSSTSHEPFSWVLFSRSDRGRPGWQGHLLVMLGWSGVALAHVVARLPADSAFGGTVFWTVGIALVSLLAVGGGVAIAIAAPLSPTRHVFHSRPAFLTAAVVLVVAAVAIAVLIIRAPFDDIAAHGKPLDELVSDLTGVIASLICLVGGGIVLRAAWRERGLEQDW